MPKGFSEQEREQIRARLIDAGRELFGRYGLRKTSVEDLTRAAGISKGAFYLFFESKELLFFEIVERFEQEFRVAILDDMFNTSGPPAERFKAALGKALNIWKHNSIFTQFSRDDYAYLLRKVPPESLQQHARSDDVFIASMLDRWRAEGLAIEHDPQLVSSLVRALFFVSLHADDFDDAAYARMFEVLLDLVTGYVLGAE